MKLRDLIILLLISFASLFGFIIIYLIAGEPPPSLAFPTWTSLLQAPVGIFPLHLDPISLVEPVGYFDTATVITELEELLDDPKVLIEIYENYKTIFKKNVSQELSTGRQEIFREKLIQIAIHNFLFVKKKKSWTKGITQFTDLTPESFLSNYSGKAIPPFETLKWNDTMTPPSNSTEKIIPKFFDLRSQGLITPIKNQGQCSSSCAFGVASLIESAIERSRSFSTTQTNDLLDLSEQELMDCAVTPENSNGTGCHGNWPKDLLDYVLKNGLSLETDYPYAPPLSSPSSPPMEEEDESENFCRAAGIDRSTTIKGYAQILGGDEENWKKILLQRGEILVIAHLNSEWQDYRGGLFDSDSCNDTINGSHDDDDHWHCLNIIGYGIDGGKEEGEGYWLIKNSWGVTWGQNGVMKLGQDACRILDFPAFYVTEV